MLNVESELPKGIEYKTQRSQRFFNPVLLPIYDFFVFNFISPFLWGCKKKLLIDRYRLLCGDQHLEVGVGTGYLVDKASPAISNLGLMDLSTQCLNRTKSRLIRYAPKQWRRNILLLIDDVHQQFDSVSINYVMHCVAGCYKEKGIAFGNLKSLLKEDGVLFGVSVIKTPISNSSAQGFMKLLNWLGVFNNEEDRAEDLEDALSRHFRYSKVDYRSSAALFFATDSEEKFLSLSEIRHDIS